MQQANLRCYIRKGLQKNGSAFCRNRLRSICLPLREQMRFRQTTESGFRKPQTTNRPSPLPYSRRASLQPAANSVGLRGKIHPRYEVLTIKSVEATFGQANSVHKYSKPTNKTVLFTMESNMQFMSMLDASLRTKPDFPFVIPVVAILAAFICKQKYNK